MNKGEEDGKKMKIFILIQPKKFIVYKFEWQTLIDQQMSNEMMLLNARMSHQREWQHVLVTIYSI